MDISIETPYAVLEDDGLDIPQWMMCRNDGSMGFWVGLVGVRVMTKRHFHFLKDMRDGVCNQDGMQDKIQIQRHMRVQPPSHVKVGPRSMNLYRHDFQLSGDLILRRRKPPALGHIIMFF